jgi:hypothetical protein
MKISPCQAVESRGCGKVQRISFRPLMLASRPIDCLGDLGEKDCGHSRLERRMRGEPGSSLIFNRWRYLQLPKKRRGEAAALLTASPTRSARTHVGVGSGKHRTHICTRAARC